MVTAKTQYNLKNAKEYFEEHLCVGDYYDEGQRVAGEWFGLGAERLGLSGKVRAEDFLRLCENQHPATGETLTQRLNTTRMDEAGDNAANRRIFYDFTFSPPKSVSVAALVGEDERILEAHAQAVRSALREFEAFAATRVRAGGGRMTAPPAILSPPCSRMIRPAPLTRICTRIALSSTRPLMPVENRWKALQNYELLRARKFAENVYYHELARELRGFRLSRFATGARRFSNRRRFGRNLRTLFQTAMRRLTRRLAKLLAEKPELRGGEFQGTARASWRRQNGRGNKRI